MTVKLLSTVIDGDSVELTYADNPELDAALSLVIVRVPKEIDNSKSLAWHRYWALNNLQAFLGEQMEQERKVSEGRA